MELDTLGERIVSVRGALRQEDFAERFGISRKTLIRYENNERIPPADFVQRLVVELGVDANWLLLGVGKPPKPELTPREATLLDNFRHCPEDEQNAIVKTSALLSKRGRGKGKMKDVG